MEMSAMESLNFNNLFTPLFPIHIRMSNKVEKNGTWTPKLQKYDTRPVLRALDLDPNVKDLTSHSVDYQIIGEG